MRECHVRTVVAGAVVLFVFFIGICSFSLFERKSLINKEFEDRSRLFGGGDFDSLSHEDSVMSDFGTTEFKCTGTCYCEPEQERKSILSPSVVSRGVIGLIAATSSIIALKKAKDYFDEECKRVFTSDENLPCVLSSIRTKGVDCDGGSGSNERTGSEDNQVFKCEGKCLPRWVRSIKSKRLLEMSKKFQCDKLSYEDQISVNVKEIRKKWFAYFRIQKFVKLEFQRRFMDGFCRKNSYRELETGVVGIYHLCSGTPKGGGINHYVYCKRII